MLDRLLHRSAVINLDGESYHYATITPPPRPFAEPPQQRANHDTSHRRGPGAKPLTGERW